MLLEDNVYIYIYIYILVRPVKLPFEPSPSYKELLNQNDVYNFYEGNGDDDDNDSEYVIEDENNNNESTIMETTVVEEKKDVVDDVKKVPDPEDGDIKITPRIGTTVNESDMHTPNPDLDFKKSVHLESSLASNELPPSS